MGKQGITQDFLRRVEFRVFKYAMICHWLLPKTDNEIDKGDVNWGFRLAMLHLSDLRRLLNDVEYADLQDMLRRAENLRLKFGAQLQARHLLMYIHRQLKNAQCAEALFSLLIDKEKGATVGANPVALLGGTQAA
jgi:hypothetical protein